MSQIDRVSRLIHLLKTRPGISREEILEVLEISLATFKRDLAFIRDRFNQPIFWDASQRCYHLDENSAFGPVFETPNIYLSPDEIFGLLMIEHFLENLQPGFLADRLKPVRDRFEKLLDFPPSWQELKKRILIFRQAGRHFRPLYFQKISQALVERRRLTVLYSSRSNEAKTEREISPQRLVYYRDNWYLDAWCHLRNAHRSFALEKIKKVKLLSTRAYEIPEQTLSQNLSHGYGIFSGLASNKALLRFNDTRARWIADEEWHPKQKGYFKKGYYYLEIPYADDRELILDILRYGPDVEVLEPMELREKVLKRLAEAVRLYGGK